QGDCEVLGLSAGLAPSAPGQFRRRLPPPGRRQQRVFRGAARYPLPATPPYRRHHYRAAGSSSRNRSRIAMSNVARVSVALVPAMFPLAATADPAELHNLAHEYYQWRDTAYPVATSAQGDHRFDDRLTDYRMPAVLERREHVRELLTRVNAIATDDWSK